MGLETENAVHFELHMFHIFRNLARLSAFTSAGLNIEIHMTAFFYGTQARISALHIPQIHTGIYNEVSTQLGCTIVHSDIGGRVVHVPIECCSYTRLL